MEHEKIMEQLGARIKENYERLEHHWLHECYVPDILEDAMWIAAVKLVVKNFPSWVSNDAAIQLLKIQDPLEALADIWVSETGHGFLEMSDVIDREIDHDWLMDYEDYDPGAKSVRDESRNYSTYVEGSDSDVAAKPSILETIKQHSVPVPAAKTQKTQKETIL